MAYDERESYRPLLVYDFKSLYMSFNPLSPTIKLQILLLCFHHFLEKYRGEAVKISIELNFSDYVFNSHDII